MKAELTSCLADLFTGLKLTGMFGLSDPEDAFIVYPFFGALVDGCCRIEKTVHIAQVCTARFENKSWLYSKYLKSGWIEEKLELVDEKLSLFELFTRETSTPRGSVFKDGDF